jgi:hypothetical protein
MYFVIFDWQFVRVRVTMNSATFDTNKMSNKKLKLNEQDTKKKNSANKIENKSIWDNLCDFKTRFCLNEKKLRKRFMNRFLHAVINTNVIQTATRVQSILLDHSEHRSSNYDDEELVWFP